jgi:hypothetical protein
MTKFENILKFSHLGEWWLSLRIFSNLVIIHLLVYEDGTEGVFGNVGI